ncbi:MAG: hypothetical protein FWD48_12415 [Oscillospiraceae bacterium]|nr:hypothetical protein [Oscillospiraceae bacterium]
MVWFIFMLILNFAISWVNAYSTGRVWSESKEIGGWMRISAWSGYIMAIAGFTMVYGCLILLLSIGLYPSIPWLYENVELELLIDVTSDLLYLLIIAAVIPTGIIIWLNNMVAFWKRRTFGDGVEAAWNTYANIRNIVDATREVPAALQNLTKVLFKGNSKGKTILVKFALFVIILALLNGFFTASAIKKRADRSYNLIDAARAQYA